MTAGVFMLSLMALASKPILFFPMYHAGRDSNYINKSTIYANEPLVSDSDLSLLNSESQTRSTAVATGVVN